MARNGKKPRRLVVGDETFLWSVRHHHTVDQGRSRECSEILTIGRIGARGRLRIVFRESVGRLVPDGYLHSGGVGTGKGKFLNLHEPGTVRALLDEALAGGWQPDNPPTEQRDGWDLFETVVARRDLTPPD